MQTTRKDIISVESGIFADMRLRLDELLTATLKKMTDLNITEGTVALKLDIGLRHREDGNGEVHWVPGFEWKLGSSLKLEAKDNGLCAGMDEGVLEYDTYHGCYVIRETQATLFEDD